MLTGAAGISAWLGWTLFQVPSCGCWQDSVRHGLLTRGHSQVLAMWVGLPNTAACLPAKRTEVTVFCNLITKVTSHHFSCILLRSKSPGSAPTQGEEITQGGGVWGPSAAHPRAQRNSSAVSVPSLTHLSPSQLPGIESHVQQFQACESHAIADPTIILGVF